MKEYKVAVNRTGFDDIFVPEDHTVPAEDPKDAAEQYAVYLESETEEGLEGAFVEIYDIEEGERYHFLGEEL